MTIIVEMLHHVKRLTYSDSNISILLIGMVVTAEDVYSALSNMSCDRCTCVLLALYAVFLPQ